MGAEPGLPPDPHLSPAATVADQLGVDPRRGLTEPQVEERRLAHGPNRLTESASRSWLSRLTDPFRDFMIVVLLAAAVLSGLIGDLVDTLAILVIVLLNAGISIVQEWRADRAMQSLRQLATPQATVRRAGRDRTVQTEHLVPGDVVLLQAGNLVPADLRLHDVAQLRVDESALTGESVASDKGIDHLPQGEHALGDRHNMAFRGTLVTHGRAAGLVVATGASTQIGQVALLLAQALDRSTPLQRRLAAFGKRLSLVVLAICVLVFGIGVLRGEPVLLMALTAISLAVAAIPEALPAVVTVLLALGARRLVRVNALVRRLPAVETLGSVSTICSDKTGTLTLNKMHVRHVDALDDPPDELLRACALCNDASVQDGGWIGDPTETALMDRSRAQGIDIPALQAQWPRCHEWPFDAERKRMTTLHRRGTGWRAYVKGAPESLLARCDWRTSDAGRQPLDRADILRRVEAMASQGMRVLAIACRDGDPPVAQQSADDFERGLTLLGLVGLIDPPRPEAQAAIAQCHQAGVRVVMITGDHPGTALAIGTELGIATAGAHRVLTGADLAEMDDAQLGLEVLRVPIYARMDPAQKIRIVRALQAHGQFVAMTGDGVNDAPALKAADIGVAMGLGGTDVARESASLVLLDDNFATIVGAVREGRRIFDNIRKFIRYALTGNSGEIWVLLLAPLLALPTPLLPIHILWVNLVTDGLPGLALAAEPAERGVMQRPPRPPDESVFAHGLWQHTLWVGLLIGGLCLAVQAWALANGHAHWQTMVFTTLTVTQMAHILAIRSETESLFSQGLSSNRPLTAAVAMTLALQLATIYVPWLQPLFRTQALSALELGLCLGCGAVVLAAVECEKAWRRR